MPRKWTFKDQFPTDSNFVCRITGAKFGKSKSSGNPMITVDWEVASPGEVEVGDEVLNIAGVGVTNYYTVKSFEKDGTLDEEKTKGCQKRTREFYVHVFGEDSEVVQKLDFENPDVESLKGKCVLAQMSPDVEKQRKNPTAAQIELARKKSTYPEGDVMKNPMTGKELITYRPQIREIFGPAPEDMTKF